MIKFFKLVVMAALVCSGVVQAKDKTIDISYVKSPFNLQMIVMKEQQLLEKKAQAKGLSVKWHEITAGPQQAQALASGDLDIAGVMNTTSILMANGVGNPIKIVAGVARPTDVFAIVGAKGGVSSIAELKGKTVAGPKGTVLYQTLVAALVKNKLSIKDIKFVQMDIPQAFAALQSKQIDAALLAANMVIKAEAEGGKVLATATGLTSPLLVMASTDTVIKNHPDWIELAVAAHDEAAKWIADNTEEAIALGAKVQGVSVEEAKKLYNWSYFTQRLNSKDIENMYTEMDFMLQNDMMRQKIRVEDIVLPSALEVK